jgi:DNA-binding XRE family transcriptional regulator
MIAFINKSSMEIRGNIPAEFLEITRKYFGANAVRVLQDEDETGQDITKSTWYKEQKRKQTPGSNLRNWREINGMTQKELADKLTIQQHRVSEMEHDKRGISKDIARQLSRLFKTPIDAFI